MSGAALLLALLGLGACGPSSQAGADRSFFDDLRGAPRRLAAWRPAWRLRATLGRRLEEALNGPRK